MTTESTPKTKGRKPLDSADRRVLSHFRLAPDVVAALKEHGDAGKLIDAAVRKHLKLPSP